MCCIYSLIQLSNPLALNIDQIEMDYSWDIMHSTCLAFNKLSIALLFVNILYAIASSLEWDYTKQSKSQLCFNDINPQVENWFKIVNTHI